MTAQRAMAVVPAALSAFCVLVTTPNVGEAATLTVSAQANIFGAGHSPPDDTPSPSGGGGGVAPPDYIFTAASGLILTFSSVTGSVDVNAGTGSNGPDGPAVGDVTEVFDVASHNGIAGLRASTFAFNAGVFLSPAEPADPAPPRLDFTTIGTEFTTLSPAVGQTFFIGDGQTSSGSAQQFIVPSTASRLYLGLLDHSGGTTGPGFYGDNSGSFTATFSIAPVPEPSSLLLVAGMAYAGVYGRRSRRDKRA